MKRLDRRLLVLGIGLFLVSLIIAWPPSSAFMADWTEPSVLDLDTATPWPTETPTEIPSETPVEFSSPTPWPTPTDMPEEPTPTLDIPTDTPEPTLTPEPTDTPQPSDTPEPSATPSPTRTRRPTRTPTPSKTPTAIATATSHRKVTPTPVSHSTATPRSQPSPEPTQAMVGTYLTIEPMGPIPVGKRPNLIVHLTTVGGWPVADQSVELLLGDVHIRQARTDASGAATLMLQIDLPVGVYTVEAVYNGSRNLRLAPSTGYTQVEIVSTAIEIRVVPPLPGINFSLGEHTFASDENGIARIDVSHVGLYTLELLPLEQLSTETMRLEFLRWADSSFSTQREVEIPLEDPLELGLGLYYQVSLNFVDRQAQLVTTERITELTLKGSDGAMYAFTEFGPQWLPANRVARRVHGLEVTPTQYSVESVMIDGSSVVNASQQRFYLRPNDLWIIEVLLYSAHLSAHDAFLGFPMGTGVRLEYPDGHNQEFAFGPDNELQLSSLARGLYRVTVLGVQGQGLSFPTPVALSRDQTVSIPILSFLDLALSFILMASLALALLFSGRPHLLRLFLPLLPKQLKIRAGKPPS